MSIVKNVVNATATLLLVVSIVCGQEQTQAGSRSTTTITAAGAADHVRFTAPSTEQNVQWRLRPEMMKRMKEQREKASQEKPQRSTP